MRIADRLNALDRLQRGRRFKLIATGVVVVLAIVAALTVLYVSQDTDPELRRVVNEAAEARVALEEASEASRDEVSREQLGELFAEYRTLERRASRLRLEAIEAGDFAITPDVLEWVYPAIAVGAAAGIAAVWLGLSLTYLALAAIGIGVALPLIIVGPGTRGFGLLIAGIVPLIVLLLTLLELARLALSPSYPFTAIAKNVLSEAVRMRISVVFIVVLVLLLAVIPLVLDEDQPLNYRVSQWIQYGGGLGFAVLALLTVFFSTASVSFEQRDKLIWQTVSKPVASWQYVLGKWMGVMTLNLVLLSMTAGAVFIFTQYLRNQPAQSEIAPYITEDGFDTRVLPGLMSDDRRILENEVLVARRSVEPEQPTLADAMDLDPFMRRVNAVIERREQNEPGFRRTDETVAEVAEQVYNEEFMPALRAIPRGGARQFVFEGLGEAREQGEDLELTLRYRIQAGSNDPSLIYRLGFRINGEPYPRSNLNPAERQTTRDGVQQVALDAMQRLNFPAFEVADDGTVELVVFNFPDNPFTASFEPGDLQVLYPVGGYELNFAKAVVVMWIKLGFIAAVAITASTFLSFPVAVLMSIVVLFAAESAGFLSSSLDNFGALTDDDDVRPFRLVVRFVAMPIAWFFESYAQMKPVERLTTGRVLGWGDFGFALGWILAWTAAVLAAGVAIFRKRELAIYSGS